MQPVASQQPIAAAAPILELRSEATIDGSEVTLKQLCRWQDDQALAPLADVVVARLSQTNPVRQIGVDEIKSALHDAGANLSQIQFSGSASCAVRRSEVDDATFARLLTQDGATPDTASAQSANNVASGEIIADAKQTQLLDLLMTDLSDKFKLSADQMDVRFDVRNQADLMLTSPRCRFDIDSQRITALGSVSWDVTIHSPNGQRSATILATAHAWQNQLVLTRPLSTGQTVLARDITTRRALVDDIEGAPIATNTSQLVGQVLTRDMKKGDVLLIDSVKLPPLVMEDQFITVSIPHQGVTIQTVARAMDSGAKGETIRARNESTNEIYSVVVTDKNAGEVKPSGEQNVASAPRESATEH